MDAEDEGTAEEAGGTDMGFWSGWWLVPVLADGNGGGWLTVGV